MIIQLQGESGLGKSFSLRNLNPEETMVLSADKKGLPWAGWRAMYNKEKKNYIETSDFNQIKSYMLAAVKSLPNIKIMVIDTLNSALTDKLHADKKKPDFDLWRNLGEDVYSLYEFIRSNIPDEIIVIVICHTQQYKTTDENFQEVWKTKLSIPGKAVNSLNIHSFVNYVIAAEYDNSEQLPEDKYKLRTQTNGLDNVKSTYGVLERIMPNDMAQIIKLIRQKDLMTEPESASVITA